MNVTELFTQSPDQWSEAMDALLAQFQQQDDCHQPFEHDRLCQQFAQPQMPEQGMALEHYLARLSRLIPTASHLTSPCYMGHMTAPLPSHTAALSRLLVMLNQNPMKMESSRGVSFLEREVLAKLHHLIYQRDADFYQQHMHSKDAALGVMTSGGTIANVTALWLARNQACGDNLFALYQQGYQGAVILGSRLMHYSFDKGMDLLGLGARAVWRLATDSENRLSITALEAALIQAKAQKLKVLAIVGVAGSTDFGSIDPLEKMAAIASREQIHFHVDAAWGGPTLFSRRYGSLLAGIAKADTVTLDGHKQLLVPLGTGMLLCQRQDLLMTVKREAPYAIRASSFDQGRFTLEGTRPANAIYLDAAFSLFGRQGYGQLIEQNYDKARLMATLIAQDPAFELICPPVMNLLSYRCIPTKWQGKVLDANANEEINAFNIQLQKRQRAQGHGFVSRTLRSVHRYGEQPLVLLRAVLINSQIEVSHIKALLVEQKQLGQQIAHAGRQVSISG